ncbi:hypothetical protein [Saccharopolyspora shandongensis]
MRRPTATSTKDDADKAADSADHSLVVLSGLHEPAQLPTAVYSWTGQGL